MNELKLAIYRSLVTLSIVRFNEKVFEINVMVNTTPDISKLKEGLRNAIKNNRHLAIESELEVDEILKNDRILAFDNFLKVLSEAKSIDDLNIKKELNDGYCEEEETDNISFIQLENKSVFII